MDDRQFDTLARRIGTANRRGFLKALLGIGGVAVTGMLGVEAASAVPEERVPLCHALGNGEFQLITVAENAVATHLAHGDQLLGTIHNCTSCGDVCGFSCEPTGCCHDSSCLS